MAMKAIGGTPLKMESITESPVAASEGDLVLEMKSRRNSYEVA